MNCTDCTRRFQPFVCGYCEQVVSEECKSCHSNKNHQGRRIGIMTICPRSDCGKVTPAPSHNMIRVHFLRVIDGKQPDDIKDILNADKWRRKPITTGTVKWLRQNMIHLCQHCWKRLLPDDDELRVFVQVARRSSRADTAAKYGLAVHKVKTICEKCRDVYSLNYRDIRSADAFMRRLIRNAVQVDRTNKMDALMHPRKTKHPLSGYNWQRADHDSGIGEDDLRQSGPPANGR